MFVHIAECLPREFIELRDLRVNELRSLRDISLTQARFWQLSGDRRALARNIADARRLHRLAMEEARAVA